MKKLILSSLSLCAFLYASGTTHWGYTGHEAPEFWGDLDPKFAMCKLGKNQSPIDINKNNLIATQGLEAIEFIYHADATEVINNGHAIQVNVDSHSSINIDGKHFVLKQFHFHSPSENTINGRSFPLEAHFVHVANDGSLAVIAVLYELGDENPALKKIFTSMPKEHNHSQPLKLLANEIEALLPKERSYYRFSGSLTTPPCSEGVRWMVLKSYQTMSKEQLKQFTEVIKDNNRPVQPINARKVLQ